MSQEKLERQISAGAEAEQEIRDYGDRLGALQSRYLGELLLSARRGDDTASAVYKLVALDDLVTDLRSTVKRGKDAYAKREEKRQNVEH